MNEGASKFHHTLTFTKTTMKVLCGQIGAGQGAGAGNEFCEKPVY